MYSSAKEKNGKTMTSVTNRKVSLIDTSVGSVMVKAVKTLESDKPLSDCVAIMKKSNVGCVIVMEGGKPVGIFTERDIISKIADGTECLGWPMSRVMTKPLTVISPTATIWDAISLMGRLGIRRLPVVDKEKLVGILTEADLLKLVLSHQNLILESVAESIPAATREQLRSITGHFELEKPPARMRDS